MKNNKPGRGSSAPVISADEFYERFIDSEEWDISVFLNFFSSFGGTKDEEPFDIRGRVSIFYRHKTKPCSLMYNAFGLFEVCFGGSESQEQHASLVDLTQPENAWQYFGDEIIKGEGNLIKSGSSVDALFGNIDILSNRNLVADIENLAVSQLQGKNIDLGFGKKPVISSQILFSSELDLVNVISSLNTTRWYDLSGFYVTDKDDNTQLVVLKTVNEVYPNPTVKKINPALVGMTQKTKQIVVQSELKDSLIEFLGHDDTAKHFYDLIGVEDAIYIE